MTPAYFVLWALFSSGWTALDTHSSLESCQRAAREHLIVNNYRVLNVCLPNGMYPQPPR